MTDRKDFKRRVRDRMAKTGESYVTARNRVEAAAPEDIKPFDVVEPVDATEQGAKLGFKCRVMVFPALLQHVGLADLLERVRDVLLACEDDRDTEIVRRVAFHGEDPRTPATWMHDVKASIGFMRRARAGLGGTTPDGRMLAMHIAGPRGLVPVVCSTWRRGAGLMLTVIESEDLFSVL
jgi:hypothetical protein